MPSRKGKEEREIFWGRDRRVLDCVRKVMARAASREPLLILGPSGSGKTLLAKTLHSSLGAVRLLTLESAALPGPSQAAALRAALAARPGALLVKEICSLSAAAQALLARAVGGNNGGDGPMVICTTARDFQAAAASGKISAALFAALRGRTADLPPLSDRKNDILPLMRSLSARPPVFTAGAKEAIISYGWPGNVRELKRFLRIAACRSGRLDAAAARDCLELPFF